MKTFVVGDIHGRCAQLLGVLDMLPRDQATDRLVFLGDLIDRGPDIPGCVEQVMSLYRASPEKVICLRGNHEQMLLDFLDEGEMIWVTTATGGDQTFMQYTQKPLVLRTEADFAAARDLIAKKIPANQIEFLRQLPLYHEDDYAIYVHAGLEGGKHPSESSPHALLWNRDLEFQKSYYGKCLWPHADAAFALARPCWPPWDLRLQQRHRDRHRQQPALAAHLSVAAGLHFVPDVRRRPHRDPPDHHADSGDFEGNAAEGGFTGTGFTVLTRLKT